MRRSRLASHDGEQKKTRERARTASKGTGPNHRAAHPGERGEDKPVTPCDLVLHGFDSPSLGSPPAVVPCLVVIPAGAAIDDSESPGRADRTG